MIRRIESITARVADLKATLADAKIATADEMTHLREIKSRYDAISKKLENYTFNAAGKAIKDARNAFRANPSEENFSKLRDIETDREQLQAHYVKLSQELKDARRSIGAEALPIIEQIFDRAASKVEKELEKVRSIETKLSETYGIPAEPGLVSAAIQNLLDSLPLRRPSELNPFGVICEVIKF